MISGTTLAELLEGAAPFVSSPAPGLRASINCTETQIQFTPTPPQFRPIMAVASPALYLKRFQLSMDFASVKSYLFSFLESTDLLQLYRHYFPVEFASSPTSLSINPRSRVAYEEGCGAYSPREIEFFGLVNERLFPINIDGIVEGSGEGEREDLIELEYWGHGFEIDDPDYSRASLGWQLLASIFCYRDERLEQSAEFEPYAHSFAKLDADIEIDYKLLKDLCNAEGAPAVLEYLPLVVDVFNHETGNLFIDPDEFYPVYDARWSDGQETIDMLAQEHIEAHIILDKCEMLVDWIEASPKNFRKVIDVCNQSNSKKQPHPKKKSRGGPSPVRHRVRIRA
jgi:hypothetical protein